MRSSGGTAPAGGLVPALRLRVPDRAQKAFEKAAEAMRRERWQESRSLFETAVREYPQYDLAYNGLGMVQMQMMNWDLRGRRFPKPSN